MSDRLQQRDNAKRVAVPFRRQLGVLPAEPDVPLDQGGSEALEE
ncbi:hypothetical protein [Serratia marcescens]